MKISGRTNKQKTQLPELGRIRSGESENTRWLPKRPPARAQVAAVVMVVIIREPNAPFARVKAGDIMRPMRAALDAAGMNWHDMGGQCTGARATDLLRTKQASAAPHRRTVPGFQVRSRALSPQKHAPRGQKPQARLLLELLRCSADTVVADFCSASANDGEGSE
ncbi:hypothetical protein QTI17_03640 [Variovorax sp. J31P179]|uniref:hypothetical protein n=1 Tax=Variovorax sp. J31P179 TaxID=3053508 RepID=UPI002575A7D0|nr:hypothetical protein [Variovorax sp. J31P179]MDM0079677.1 hypothetical protein [Variovorax sp. J31P179]